MTGAGAAGVGIIGVFGVIGVPSLSGTRTLWPCLNPTRRPWHNAHMPPPAARIVELPDLAATSRLAATVAATARPGDAILLEGPLGAGKTEFARAFLRAATRDPGLEVPSPTFTLVQTYDTPLSPVHHFDLWRLDGPAALAELGWDDARAGIVLVEWPDRLGALRPVDALTITVEMGGETGRRAVLAGWSGRLEHLP